MKLVACINAYDELPKQIIRCVREVKSLGCTDVILVDGAYSRFPNAQPVSPFQMIDWFLASANAEGLGSIYHGPSDVWAGDEVQKRQTMLDLTLAITTSSDFWMLWDADFHIDSEPIDLKPILTDYMHSGATFSRWGDVLLTDSPHDAGWYPVRLLYRCIPGMRLTRNHYTYEYPGSASCVMNNPQDGRALELPVKIRHRPERPDQPGRRQKQVEYYERRHADNTETP